MEITVINTSMLKALLNIIIPRIRIIIVLVSLKSLFILSVAPHLKDGMMMYGGHL